MRLKGGVVVFLILAAAVALRLYLLYWGFIYDGFLVPPGDDAVAHIGLVQAVAENKSLLIGSSYPLFYHSLLAFVALLFNLDPIKVVTYSSPLLVVLPVVAVYILASKWFDRTSALAAAALVGLAGAGQIYSYGDGNYPNLFGTSFLMVFAIAYGLMALREKPLKNSLVAAVFLILLALTHHFSFMVFLMLAAVYIVLLLFVLLVEHKRLSKLSQVRWTFGVGFLLAVAAAMLIYGKNYFLPIITQFFRVDRAFNLSSTFTTPIALDQYPEIVGSLVWMIGLLGLLVIAFLDHKHPWERRLFILTWVAVLLVASRFPAFGVPGRFARELTVPLAIAGGYFISYIIGQNQVNWQRLAAGGLVSIFIVMNTVMLFSSPFTLPEGFSRLIWFWPEDLPKLEAIKNLPIGSKIIMTPSSPYYQVFAPDQLLKVADPPGGARYIFLSPKPRNDPDGRVYPYFSNFDDINKVLREYPYARDIKTFSDGSVIREITASP